MPDVENLRIAAIATDGVEEAEILSLEQGDVKPRITRLPTISITPAATM
jgi:hypothetical protein